LYHWRAGADAPQTLAMAGADGLPGGWWIGEHGALEFSKDGSRLFFGTAPRPEPEDEDETPDDEKVVLDVWNWKDPLLQPMQLEQLDEEKKRTYRAVVHLADGRIVQLADEGMPDVEVGREGEADVALANSHIPYRQEISWDWPGYVDVYRIDVETGARRMLLEHVQTRADLSPGARYLTWWDRDALAWYAMDVAGGEPVNLTEAIPHPVHNELHDWPYKPNPYGSAGWTENDEAFLVYDKHDVWAVDPAGVRAPRTLTEGRGRADNLAFRYVRLDEDEQAVDPDAPMLLSAFDLGTRAGGFYRDQADGTRAPQPLVMMDRHFPRPEKAKDADVLLFTREHFEEFPDLWTSDLDFDAMRRVSDVNPQQAAYRWGTVELLAWTSLDGLPLEGMLYKPEGFDPSRKYPMMVYFYEKMSDGLHRHHAPATARSSINFSFYVSRGYLVFVPDIPYKVGYPGESALGAVVPGVTALIETGFVDEENIGVQGHSWGGYQIAYMITETNLFKAAEAGAPVANMTSAYGGIRWGTGMSRMFQYEKSQSRIGGTLWEYPLRYIDNSPLFQADKIETPVLMMHNDDDGAVPWYQGIEFFVALRRLGKPVWMLNYNGEPHGLQKYQNKRDFAIRMQQFFDHYLQGAPAPVWMEEGVPALLKGKTLGLKPAAPTPVVTEPTGSN
jgi:dipeptidyl aminopeptidase/acylaminoacyl peptidase